MEIQYNGALSVSITTAKSVIQINPTSDVLEAPRARKLQDFVLVTHQTYQPADFNGFLIDSPGEYEFSRFSVKGLAVKSFGDDQPATLYRLESAGVRCVLTGNFDGHLSESMLEDIGAVDVVILPVGGGGYSIDPSSAAKVIGLIGPKLVIPLYYQEDGLKYKLPAQSLAEFAKLLGAEPVEVVDRLKLKNLPEQLTIQPIAVS